MKSSHLLITAICASIPALVMACGSSGGTASSGAGGTTGSSAGAPTSSGNGGSGGLAFTTSSSGSDATASSSVASTGAGSAIDAGLGDFCSGKGAIPIPGSTDCTGDIGKKIFLFAMCSCTDLTVNNTLDTDSINSNNGPTKLAGGSVGVNGNYSTSAPNNIGGAVLVGGTLTAQNSYDVLQDLTCNGDAHIGAPATAESDAYLGGDVIGPPHDLHVLGKLHTPKSGNVAQVSSDGGFTIGAVNIPPPCDCSAPVDIAGIVAAFKATNDNVTNGIFPDALTAKPEYPKDLTLPCGRYYLSGVNVNQTVSVHLTGRTVLAIEGDIVVSGPFSIDLAPGASLDLFVTGNVNFMNTSAIGNVASPASTRAYIGGSQVVLAGPLSLAGNVYLPNAQFHATNDLEMWGAIFSKSILTDGHVKVHYDEAILGIDGCKPPGSSCTDCHDCVNPMPACGPGGACGPCTKNQDCCAPLECNGMGNCVAPPPK